MKLPQKTQKTQKKAAQAQHWIAVSRIQEVLFSNALYQIEFLLA